jgi:hypothetical protein
VIPNAFHARDPSIITVLNVIQVIFFIKIPSVPLSVQTNFTQILLKNYAPDAIKVADHVDPLLKMNALIAFLIIITLIISVILMLVQTVFTLGMKIAIVSNVTNPVFDASGLKATNAYRVNNLSFK